MLFFRIRFPSLVHVRVEAPSVRRSSRVSAPNVLRYREHFLLVILLLNLLTLALLMVPLLTRLFLLMMVLAEALMSHGDVSQVRGYTLNSTSAQLRFRTQDSLLLFVLHLVVELLLLSGHFLLCRNH